MIRPRARKRWAPAVAVAGAALLAMLMLAAAPASSGKRPPMPETEIGQRIEAGDTAAVRAILVANPGLVWLCDDKGDTALMLAALRGKEAFVAMLLDAGADARASDKVKLTSLHMASYVGSAPSVELLIAHGAVIDAHSRQSDTPLDYAAMEGRADVLALLLDHGANPNGGSADNAPLRYVARHGLREIAERMIAAGAIVDARDLRRETALFWAARGGVTLEAEVVMAHLQKQEPVQYEGGTEFADMATLLLDHGADVNSVASDKGTPLHAAIAVGRLDVAEVLVARGAHLDARDAFGRTPLLLAADTRQADGARLLLDHGAAVDAAESHKWTPLLVAARHGDSATCAVLLERGANVNLRLPGMSWGFFRDDFESILDAAVGSGKPGVVELLLRAGANADERKRHGETALAIAAKHGYTDVERMLREHGATN
jgi:ankyrin repeat protein